MEIENINIMPDSEEHQVAFKYYQIIYLFYNDQLSKTKISKIVNKTVSAISLVIKRFEEHADVFAYNFENCGRKKNY